MKEEKQEQLMQKIEYIINNTDSRTIRESIYSKLKSRNLKTEITTLASQIIVKNAKVEELVDKDNIKLLFFFTDALINTLGTNTDLKLEDYFTEQEIEYLKNYKEKNEEKPIYPIIFENVNYINKHHWEGTISAEELAKLNDAKVIIYNPNTQRNPKVSKKGLKINIDPKKIIEIADELVEETYEPDHIKFNVLNEGEPPIYDPKKRTLTIGKGCIINIIDGMHRKEANSIAIHRNPNLDVIWGITIYNVSEIKAHDIMVQINKQKEMPEEWLETKDYSKNENDVLSRMQDKKCNIFKIIGENEKQITLNQALVKKSNIAIAIKENYGDLIKDNDDRSQVASWLTEFFDAMLKLYSYDFFENPYEVKKISFINWKNMFYGYVALSRVLYEKESWREKFKNKMQSIDFSNTNPIWQDMGMRNTQDASTKLREKLYSMFKDGVE